MVLLRVPEAAPAPIIRKTISIRLSRRQLPRFRKRDDVDAGGHIAGARTRSLEPVVGVAVELQGGLVGGGPPAGDAVEVQTAQADGIGQHHEGDVVHGVVHATAGAPGLDRDVGDARALAARLREEGVQARRVLDEQRVLRVQHRRGLVVYLPAGAEQLRREQVVQRLVGGRTL